MAPWFKVGVSLSTATLPPTLVRVDEDGHAPWRIVLPATMSLVTSTLYTFCTVFVFILGVVLFSGWLNERINGFNPTADVSKNFILSSWHIRKHFVRDYCSVQILHLVELDGFNTTRCSNTYKPEVAPGDQRHLSSCDLIESTNSSWTGCCRSYDHHSCSKDTSLPCYCCFSYTPQSRVDLLVTPNMYPNQVVEKTVIVNATFIGMPKQVMCDYKVEIMRTGRRGDVIVDSLYLNRRGTFGQIMLGSIMQILVVSCAVTSGLLTTYMPYYVYLTHFE